MLWVDLMKQAQKKQTFYSLLFKIFMSGLRLRGLYKHRDSRSKCF